ncbi:hypothetical protein [Pseudoclavibacter helvolus]|uniref:Uncharacterized protein n=1 Tax=Pseudoclavibacter helvolus TaxID=255205 RepID=A0A7W4YI06_9MICO|nr:hypothetical protein [Pseudoclavibacter helvolus]MBB2959555.1 hypothetical protein [Pseudoclavibacter helvolus]
MSTQLEDRAKEARLLRRRSELDRLTYIRKVAELAQLGSQREIARALGIAQPNVSKTMKAAAAAPPLVEGFSGADPFEIAERYSIGELTLFQLVHELLRWDYKPTQRTDGYNDLLFSVPGSWDDIVRAESEGLIGLDVYGFVQRETAALDARQEASGEPYRGFTHEEASEAAQRFVEAASGDVLAGAA